MKRIEQRRTLSSHMNEQAKQTQQSQSKPSHASYTISNNANHTHHNTTTIIPPSPINHLHPIFTLQTLPLHFSFSFSRKGEARRNLPIWVILSPKAASCAWKRSRVVVVAVHYFFALRCFEVLLAVSLVFDEGFGCWRPMITIFATLDIQ